MNKPRLILLSLVTTISIFVSSSLLTIKPDQKKLSKDLALALSTNLLAQPTLIAKKNKLIKQHKVTLGDSFYTVFNKLNIPFQTLKNIQKLPNSAKLLNLHPKDNLHFTYLDNELIFIEKAISSNRKAQYDLKEQKINILSIHPDIETRIVFTQGMVNGSLYYAGIEHGLTDNLIMNLIQVFAWDIDFNLDIRKGDQFRLIYEKQYSDGVFLKNGRILVAEYINKSKSHQAILFTKDNKSVGYYAYDGTPLRKSFLRSPVAFTRISSKFSTSRYHPILHRIRAHRGVDYAASKGTLIKSVGKGYVSFKGYSKSFGHMIKIKHANSIETLYAHLLGYKRGMRKGKRVKQGEIIGFVGKSGRATGYHLHYEFRVNNKHKNPLKVKLPKAKKLNLKDLTQFKKQAKPLLLQFNALKYSATPYGASDQVQ